VVDTVNLYEPVQVPFASPAVLAELAHRVAASQAAAALFIVDP
jgi:hypothetical protein